MKKSAFSIFILGILFSCKDNQEVIVPELNTITINTEGYIQIPTLDTNFKIQLRGLNEELAYSNLKFTTTISEDGSFKFDEIEYVKDGEESINRYVEISTKQIIPFTAIYDINSSKKVNVNILTHLQAVRTKYLLENQQMAINEAIKTSKQEVLNLFSLDLINPIPFDQMNMFNNSKDDFILIFSSSGFSKDSFVKQNETSNSLSRFEENISDYISEFKSRGLIETEFLTQWVNTNISFYQNQLLLSALQDYYGISKLNYNDLDEYRNLKADFISNNKHTSLLNSVLSLESDFINPITYQGEFAELLKENNVAVELNLELVNNSDYVISLLACSDGFFELNTVPTEYLIDLDCVAIIALSENYEHQFVDFEIMTDNANATRMGFVFKIQANNYYIDVRNHFSR